MGAVNIEYTINVTKGGVTSEVKMEASVPEGDLDFFKKKYGAKVKAAFSGSRKGVKVEAKAEAEPKAAPKKESKKSQNKK